MHKVNKTDQFGKARLGEGGQQSAGHWRKQLTPKRLHSSVVLLYFDKKGKGEWGGEETRSTTPGSPCTTIHGVSGATEKGE